MVSSLDPTLDAPPPPFPISGRDEARSSPALDEGQFFLEGLVGIDVVDSLPLASQVFFPRDARPEDDRSALLLRRADRAADAASADVVVVGVDPLGGASDPDDRPREMFIR